MTYRTEFPDFPEADMPAIPQGFEDRSWKNDACPYFVNPKLGLGLWIDYVDAETREFPELQRFSVYRVDADGAHKEPDPVVATDDWNAVLAVALGEAFVGQCVEAFTEQQLAAIRERNATYDADTCATHDFADANMIMLLAFEEVFGREPAFLHGTDEKGNHSPEQEADIALWNAAWGHAKKAHLTEMKEVAHGL